MHLVRSRKWPIVRVSVLSADWPQASGYGCTVVTVYYKYPVNCEKYGDTCEKPFIAPESGKDHAEQLVNGMDFKVRVKPDDATTSVPMWGDAALV
jgi:hypothetical protein